MATPTYEDLDVRVRMLTRTCGECDAHGEFPYVPVRDGIPDGMTIGDARRARTAWWRGHSQIHEQHAVSA